MDLLVFLIFSFISYVNYVFFSMKNCKKNYVRPLGASMQTDKRPNLTILADVN
jgi:hypothetical protein